jgi:hypothetical protein
MDLTGWRQRETTEPIWTCVVLGMICLPYKANIQDRLPGQVRQLRTCQSRNAGTVSCIRAFGDVIPPESTPDPWLFAFPSGVQHENEPSKIQVAHHTPSTCGGSRRACKRASMRPIMPGTSASVTALIGAKASVTSPFQAS